MTVHPDQAVELAGRDALTALPGVGLGILLATYLPEEA
jgi:hypothetical protein